MKVLSPVMYCVQLESGDHVYTNVIVDRVFATESVNIVRGERWKVPITCSVPRSESSTINYQTYTDTDRRRNALAEDLDVELVKRVVTGQIRLQQDFPTSITIYEDKAMTIRQYTTQQKRLGEDIFFRYRAA